ncbi:FecR domain-containing protein [Aurantiacibacter marinus]|nr:FecR domain-containing protein [Aurantiacibacter marinus]
MMDNAGFWRFSIACLLLLAMTVPQAAHAQSANSVVTYRMVRGDTLYSIDNRFLSGGDSIAAIARINGITNPNRIPVGTVIRLPRDMLAWRNAGLVVRSFSGPVNIDGSAPQVGMSVQEGSVIRTGMNGFVSFQSADGATVALPSNSHARLERARIYRLRDLRDIEFRILGGRGAVQAPVLREEERFRTSTPVAVTAVRGTQYRVAYDETTGRSISEIVEGTVSVETETSAQLASQGFGVAVTSAGIGGLEQLLPAVTITEPGAIQTEEIVSFALSPPEGAMGARTQIARDAGFLEMIAQDVSGDGIATFEGLPDGRYFIRSRPISSNGIEGLSDTFSFRRKRLGAQAAVEASPIADGFRFAWLPQGEGITYFAFQLWQQGAAGTPLYDEIALPGSATVVTGLEPGTYVWRIAAIQADAEDGLLKVWGPEQSLIVSEE